MRLTIRVLSTLLIAGSAAMAHAQEYPSKPIRLLVPFAPGGVVDVTARILSLKLTERLGWNIVVDNRPGGNGFIAVTAAAKSAPDGYTLLMAHTGEFAVNPAVFPKIIPYELERDFTPITMISDTPMLLVANSQSPINTFRDLVAAAKAKPGEVSFSSPGNGSINHLAGEWLGVSAGVKLLHVPYKGGSPAAAAVAAGDVALGVVAIPAVMPHLKSGKIKVVGLTTATRTDFDKSWTTAREGGIPELDASNWVGLFAPKGVPQPILDKIYDEVKRTLQDPAVQTRFASAGAATGGMSPADFLTRIKKDTERYRAVVKAADIRPE
ncbi:MAG: tripartite tricarboxylate transporter substrate binding protein [Pseudomonadota bacterium]